MFPEYVKGDSLIKEPSTNCSLRYVRLETSLFFTSALPLICSLSFLFICFNFFVFYLPNPISLSLYRHSSILTIVSTPPSSSLQIWIPDMDFFSKEALLSFPL